MDQLYLLMQILMVQIQIVDALQENYVFLFLFRYSDVCLAQSITEIIYPDKLDHASGKQDMKLSSLPQRIG